MLLGILSDSHGHVGPVRRALALFDRKGVEHVIHCGDVGGREVLDELVGRPCHFVWGNTDYGPFDPSMRTYVEAMGLPWPEIIPLRLQLAGKRILVFHGHEQNMMESLSRLQADYILHGHTHQTRDERRGTTRIINPGALHRARPLTVATLNLNTDELEFIEIPR